MMKAKTREGTLTELAERSAKGKNAADKFNVLLKRLVKVPPQSVTVTKKGK
jgi:hypothetical protein